MSTLSQTARRTQGWLSDHGAKLRRAGLAVSVVMFVAILIWSLQAVAGSGHSVRIWPLAILLFICIPLAIVFTVAEFQVMTRMAGTRVGWGQSFEITIYASAANMLPLPGGAITRVAAMKLHGATVRFSSMIVALFAGIWGALAFCYSGAALALLGHHQLGGLFGAVGAGLLAALFYAAIKVGPEKRLVFFAVAIRAGSLLIDALSLMLAFWALGAVIGFGEASVFAVSSFVGSAVSIVPAGLGIRELVVGALAPVIALPVAVGFLAAAVNRIVAMVALITLALALGLRRETR